MQENLSELARKYREEMLRLYGMRSQGIEDTPPPGEPAAPDEANEAERPAPPPEAVLPLPPVNVPVTEPGDEEIVEGEPDLPEDEDGDPVLPSYIRPTAPVFPEEWEAQKAYEERNTSEGKLRVVASTADSAYPVPGARVAVFTRIGNKRHLNYLLTTDESGETPVVTLPAPSVDLSQEAENVAPYALCDIEIFAYGFFRSEAEDVHIFPGITTRQVFQLVPLPLQSEADDGITQSSAGRSGRS